MEMRAQIAKRGHWMGWGWMLDGDVVAFPTDTGSFSSREGTYCIPLQQNETGYSTVQCSLMVQHPHPSETFSTIPTPR